MSFLLDTNVVSETRKRAPDAHVMAWFQGVDQSDLFLSVLTIGELTKGIARRRARDPNAAESLMHWLRGIETLFAERLIPVDAAVAAAWGELNAARPLPVTLSLLAATARVHGLTLATRTIKDVHDTGVDCVNPWEGGTPAPPSAPAKPRLTRL